MHKKFIVALLGILPISLHTMQQQRFTSNAPVSICLHCNTVCCHAEPSVNHIIIHPTVTNIYPNYCVAPIHLPPLNPFAQRLLPDTLSKSSMDRALNRINFLRKVFSENEGKKAIMTAPPAEKTSTSAIRKTHTNSKNSLANVERKKPRTNTVRYLRTLTAQQDALRPSLSKEEAEKEILDLIEKKDLTNQQEKNKTRTMMSISHLTN